MGKTHIEKEASKAPATTQSSSPASADDPPPSYQATIHSDIQNAEWTYDAAQGFWTTPDIHGCIVVGFGNDNGNDNKKATSPEFYITCSLAYRHELRTDSGRAYHRERQRKTFLKAAEALARHRRKHQCDCDFSMFEARVRWEGVEAATSKGGPVHMSQRPPGRRNACGPRGINIGLWEALKLMGAYCAHRGLCKERCMW